MIQAQLVMAREHVVPARTAHHLHQIHWRRGNKNKINKHVFLFINLHATPVKSYYKHRLENPIGTGPNTELLVMSLVPNVGTEYGIAATITFVICK